MRKYFLYIGIIACLFTSFLLVWNNYGELVWGLPLPFAAVLFLLACADKHRTSVARAEPDTEFRAENVLSFMFNFGFCTLLVLGGIALGVLWYFGIIQWALRNWVPILLCALYAAMSVPSIWAPKWRYGEPHP